MLTTSSYSTEIDYKEWWAVGAIGVLALVLRLVNLDAQLWYDEILTLVRFIRLPAGELLTTYSSLNNHMLYSLLAKVSIGLFGETPWALRLPAALYGIGSVAALWYLARQVTGPLQAGFTALLLAVSYHHIWFSQNARGYTGLLFWTLVATTVLVNATRSASWKPWLLYVASVGAAGFTHLSAAFFFMAHAVVLAVVLFQGRFRSPPDRRGASLLSRRLAVGLAGGSLLTVVLHAPVLPQMVDTFGAVTQLRAQPTEPETGAGSTEAVHSTPSGVTAVAAAAERTQAASRTLPQVAKSGEQAGSEVAQWTNPLWTVFEIVRSFGALGPLLALGLPFVLFFTLFGALSLLRRCQVLAFVYGIHVPLTLIILMCLGFRIWPRYFFLDIGFILLAFVQGAFAVCEFLHKKMPVDARFGSIVQYLAVGCATLGVAASLMLLPKNYRHPKQDFQGALKLIRENRSPRDQVAVLGLASVPYGEFYKPGWTKVEATADLNALHGSGGSTWLVYAFTSHTESRFPDVVAFVNREFEEVRSFPGTLGDGSVHVFRRRQSDEGKGSS